MQKTKNSDWFINPAFIITTLWGGQILGHVVFSDSFDPFADETIWIVLSGVCAFLVGGGFAYVFPRRNNAKQFSVGEKSPTLVRAYLKILLPIYLLIFAFPQIFNLCFQQSLSLGEIREAMVASVVENDRGVVVVLYVHYLVVFSSLLALSYESRHGVGVISYIVFSGLIAALLTFGRTMLLLFFVSSGVVLYLQRVISKKTIFAIAVGFVILFFSLAFFMGKGGDGGFFDNVLWNFKVYIFGGVAALNHYIATGEPDIAGSLLTPNFLKSILGQAGEITPNVLPFVDVPFSVNVYTALFPWYHDAGIAGVFIGFFVIGFLSMRFFYARYRSINFSYVYSLSLYPLFMTVFEEQYLRTYTLWVMVATLLSLLYFSEKIKYAISMRGNK